MSERFQEGRALLARAVKQNSTFASRPGVLANGFQGSSHAYPVFCDRAKGAYVWDVDGNRYIDLVLGFGCVVLGHNHEPVTKAVMEAMQRGVCPTLAVREQIELAELLAKIVPNAEASYFLRSGSDSTSLAVRLARATTRRSTVLRWGYHGWHDWCAPNPNGTIPELRNKTRSFGYNSLESLHKAFADAKGDVACVIMMPFEIDLPDPGFLEGVREICTKAGALLVFDEVRSGFRVALGGAQEVFGVDADLICMSKAIANGHPLSVLCGRGEIMSGLKDVSASSTFFRGRDGFAAALATIDELATLFPTGEPARISRRLGEAFEKAITKTGAPIVLVGHQASPFMGVLNASPENENEVLQTFCAGMLTQGVLLHPSHHWFFNLALSDDDMLEIERAATRVLSDMMLDGVLAV